MKNTESPAKLCFLFPASYSPRFAITAGYHTSEIMWFPLVRFSHKDPDSVLNLVSDSGYDYHGSNDEGGANVETWDPAYNDLHLHVYVGQGWADMPDVPTVNVSLEWHDRYSITFRHVEKMASAAKKIDARLARIAKREGDASDWREAVRRYLTVLGIKHNAAYVKDDRNSNNYTDNEFIKMDREATIRKLEKLIGEVFVKFDKRQAA